MKLVIFKDKLKDYFVVSWVENQICKSTIFINKTQTTLESLLNRYQALNVEVA